MAEESVKVESDVAAVKADIARVETKLEVFREFVNDRFDRTDDFMRSNFAILTGQIAAHSDQLGAHSDQLKAQTDQLKALSDRIDAQSSQLDTILAAIQALKAA